MARNPDLGPLMEAEEREADGGGDTINTKA